MNDAKYIGMDAHQATILVAVRDSRGNLVLEAILETKAETILQFICGLRGSLQVTFEEGTWAAWLYDLLQPHVARVLACDPRKNALLKAGNKSDRIDARKLSELLYLNKLNPVYHGGHDIRARKELARSYITMTRDLTRVMSRLKAMYRSWGIACAGQQVYAPRYRAEWLAKIAEAAVRHRAELYYQQFDALAALRQEARRELLAEARKHPALRLLRQIPSVGPSRAALLIALMQTPHRFRTKRQLWAYCGLALRTYDSGEYRFVGGQLKRSKKAVTIRGLNKNHNHDLKNILKGAATRAAGTAGPLQNFYQARLASGMKPPMARLTLARKIAVTTLLVWKKGGQREAESSGENRHSRFHSERRMNTEAKPQPEHSMQEVSDWAAAYAAVPIRRFHMCGGDEPGAWLF
jgi:transposase